MPSRLTPNQLDELLALQLTVAWAGEAAGEPTRLGWWKTDLVDAQGGGDLFARLTPAFEPSELSECGLLVDHAKAVAVRQRLMAEYPEEPHALCRIWAIWRMKREA
jgi:hypothetical protein